MQLTLLPSPKPKPYKATIRRVNSVCDCPFCGHRHEDNQSTWYCDGSFVDEGYSSGHYCLECWIPFNISLIEKDIYHMAIGKKDKDILPTIKSITEAKGITKPWDFTHTEVVDQPLVIFAIEPIETLYGDAYLCDCEIDSHRCKVMIGAKMLIATLENIVEHLPISATIVKIGKFYSFTD